MSFPKSVSRAGRIGRVFLGAAARAIDDRLPYRLFPTRPRVLNFMADDICDSRCRMCLVWKKKRDRELAPDELSRILGDPLFRRLDYIGVSGGEPTLRADLPELFQAIVSKKPSVRGTGIITNGAQKDRVLPSLLRCAEVCRRARIPFNVMVSLDGIGEIDDLVRGRAGAFENAVAVIRHLRDKTDIPVAIGCTITKLNCRDVDDVLEFCRREGIPGRFRIADFIDRLDNKDLTGVIRCFTDLEAYHLALFFAKLELTYETSESVRATYRSIRRMLVEGGTRTAACPYRRRGVMLDCRGGLAYCAPRSPVLGNGLERSAQKIYIGNLSVRASLRRKACPDCIHDYHAAPPLSDVIRKYGENDWRRRMTPAKTDPGGDKKAAASPVAEGKPGHFLIIGWYGTETAGDKAILGEIIYRIRRRNPDSLIELASFHPFVSKWTLRELGDRNVRVLPAFSRALGKSARTADEVIMGGGPLMHIDRLDWVLNVFQRAARAGRRTRIAGCGIGPLDAGESYVRTVERILRLADTVELRDSSSVRWAEEAAGRRDIIRCDDYSVAFVKRWNAARPAEQKVRAPFLNLFLRDWTREYRGPRTDAEFEQTKTAFEREMGDGIRDLCRRFALRPRLLPMHAFCVGNDDRDFNRRFAARYLADLQPVVPPLPLSVEEILAAMTEAALSICMRYHSVVFARTLDVPFIAVDYTHGGKIRGYLEDLGETASLLTLQDVAEGRWRRSSPVIS